MKRLVKICLALALIVSLAVILRWTFDSRRAARDREDASQTAGLTGSEQSGASQSAPPEPPPEEPDPPEPPEPLPEEAAHLAQVDLAALQEVNEDVIGWIEIPGTQLSYPLVQGEDNHFYLTHNWKGESNSAGSVFLEETNPRDLTGFHLIAYGHRMRSGSMFGSLRRYSDPNYFLEHPCIYVVDETAVRRYDIFAVHEAGVTSLVYRLDLETSELEEEFLQFCLDSSVIDTGVIPEAGAQVLTLSTCTGRGYDSRWVVQGVLVQRYETAQ